MFLQQTGKALRLRISELKHHFHFAIIENANVGRVVRGEKPLQGLALVQDGFPFGLLLRLNLFWRFCLSLLHRSPRFVYSDSIENQASVLVIKKSDSAPSRQLKSPCSLSTERFFCSQSR